MKRHLVLVLVFSSGCSLIVGTDTRVVRDGGDSSAAPEAGACSCVDTATTCRKTCSSTKTACEDACKKPPLVPNCKTGCDSAQQDCNDACTSTCTSCVTTNGCSSTSRCSGP